MPEKDYTEMSTEELEAEAERIGAENQKLSEEREEIRQKQRALNEEVDPIAAELEARRRGGSQIISPTGIESGEEVGQPGG